MDLIRNLGSTYLNCFTAEEAKRIQHILYSIEAKCYQCDFYSQGGAHVFEKRFYTDSNISVQYCREIRNDHDTKYTSYFHIYHTDIHMELFNAMVYASTNSLKESSTVIYEFHDGPWVDRFCKKALAYSPFSPTDF